MVLVRLTAPMRLGRDQTSSIRPKVSSKGALKCHGVLVAADRQVFGLADQVIHLERVFAQIRMRRLGADPVGSALQETRHRLRKYVEQRLAVRADARSCGMILPGEGSHCSGSVMARTFLK